MKISRIYSNRPNEFELIDFNVEILSVVMGEIRLPENVNKDVHNLGKTTLGRLFDFCLLARRNAGFFLFKHEDVFKDYVFYIEILVSPGKFITLKRSVDNASMASFKFHSEARQNHSSLASSDWDHFDVTFKKARNILDSHLMLIDFKPWDFRKGIGYLVRGQHDYQDVFKLKKFASKDRDWKPFMAHVLGFDSVLITNHYSKEAELQEKVDEEEIVKNQLGGSIDDLSAISGMLLLSRKDAKEKQSLLDSFDFEQQDKKTVETLVGDLDSEIASLNRLRYSLTKEKTKITKSLEVDKIVFDPESAKALFEEAGVVFPGQLKKDYQQLIEFNRSITTERAKYLKKENKEIELSIAETNKELASLSERRIETLNFLTDDKVFDKYKVITNELIELRATVRVLEEKEVYLEKLQQLRAEIRSLNGEIKVLQGEVEEDVELQNSISDSRFSEIRVFFSEIVDTVISKKALLKVFVNTKGHLQFLAEILDATGRATSADDGYTYKKLLCIAFDLAVLRAHGGDGFPKFVYHDGVFESLDDRKKRRLIGVINQYCEYGIQCIISAIDSDLPSSIEPVDMFPNGEVVLTLHDEGRSGRLFKIAEW
jgi:uncharacterized protein YydD (DUF2326 family)